MGGEVKEVIRPDRHDENLSALRKDVPDFLLVHSHNGDPRVTQVGSHPATMFDAISIMFHKQLRMGGSSPGVPSHSSGKLKSVFLLPISLLGLDWDGLITQNRSRRRRVKKEEKEGRRMDESSRQECAPGHGLLALDCRKDREGPT